MKYKNQKGRVFPEGHVPGDTACAEKARQAKRLRSIATIWYNGNQLGKQGGLYYGKKDILQVLKSECSLGVSLLPLRHTATSATATWQNPQC